MKIFVCIFLTLHLTAMSKGQNIIQNGSFEWNNGQLSHSPLNDEFGTAGYCINNCDSSISSVDHWQASNSPLIIEEFYPLYDFSFLPNGICDNSYDLGYLDNQRALVIQPDSINMQTQGMSQNFEPLVPEQEYVLEFMYKQSPESPSNFQVLLDEINACENISPNGHFIASLNAIDFSFVSYPDTCSNWSFFSQTFTTPINSEINCLRLSSMEGFDNQKLIYDQVSLRPTSTAPLTLNVLHKNIMACQGGSLSIDMEVHLDYGGIQEDEIILQIHFPNGGLIPDIENGDFNEQGQLIIPAGSLSQLPTTFTADLKSSGSEELEVLYPVVFDLDDDSPSGSMEQVAISKVYFDIFSAYVNLEIDSIWGNLNPVQLHIIDQNSNILCPPIDFPFSHEIEWSSEQGTLLSSEFNWQPSSPGDYQLLIRDDIGCEYSEAFSITDTSTSETAHHKTLVMDLIVFPNPTSKNLTFEFESPSQNLWPLEFKLYSPFGSLMYNKTIDSPVNELKLDCSLWNSGIYSYQFFTGKNNLKSGRFQVIK